jgi:hypothetical protein
MILGQAWVGSSCAGAVSGHASVVKVVQELIRLALTVAESGVTKQCNLSSVEVFF